MSDEQREQVRRDSVSREEAANKRRAEEAAERTEAKHQQENEHDAKGLVLLNNSVQGRVDEFSGTITGTVVNRRKKKVGLTQITFNLYDGSGARIGTAHDVILDLEPGARWNFRAMGERFTTYKFSELEGY